MARKKTSDDGNGAVLSPDEESVEREYQASIESLLERASKLVSAAATDNESETPSIPQGGRQHAQPDHAPASSTAEPVEQPSAPSAPNVEAKEAPPTSEDRAPRSRPAETSDQMGSLREVAKMSADEAIQTHTQRLKSRARRILGCAIPVILVSFVLFLLPSSTACATQLVALPLFAVGVLLGLEYFRIVRGLASRSPSSEKPEHAEGEPTESADGPRC
jgi:hypothetical protein